MLLTNKKELTVFAKKIHKNITIPKNEKLKFLEKNTIYNEYYGTSIFRIVCDFDSNLICVTCIKRKNSDDIFVNCVKESDVLIKSYLWSEVFEEDFP